MKPRLGNQLNDENLAGKVNCRHKKLLHSKKRRENSSAKGQLASKRRLWWLLAVAVAAVKLRCDLSH